MMRSRPSLSSTRYIRSFNVVSVLRTLYREGACSKARIAEITHISQATATRIISELVEQGIVTEYTVAESTGGRKPIIFRLNYDKIYIAGIQLVRDCVALAVCNLKGEILSRKAFHPYSLDPSDLITELTRELDSMFAENGVECRHVLGVGLAISGIVNADDGVLIRSVNLGWRDVKVAAALEQELGLPVVVENDANAAALAEFWFGCAKDAGSFMYLKTDTGVGAGVICERKLITGPRGMVGEIGHTPIMEGGLECVCGQRGCLETYMYSQGLVRRYQELTSVSVPSLNDVFARAASGDPVAGAIVDDASSALTRALSLAVTILDLDLVVIGGLWGELGDQFCGPIENRVNQVVERSGLSKTVRICGSALKEDSDILGAVGTVINRWFTPPI